MHFFFYYWAQQQNDTKLDPFSLDGNNYGNCQKPGISKTKDGGTTAVLSYWNKIKNVA